MKLVYLFLTLWFILCSARLVDKSTNLGKLPVYFKDYNLEIRQTDKLFDTIRYKRSGKEFFKIVLFDEKGASYFEYYVWDTLRQKGFYSSCSDTLYRTVSSRAPNGISSESKLRPYFGPVKSGLWHTFSGQNVSIDSFPDPRCK